MDDQSATHDSGDLPMNEPRSPLSRRESLKLMGTGFFALPAALGANPLRVFTSDAIAEAPATFFNRNIPSLAHRKMGDLAPGGLATFSMTPSGGWVIATLDRRRFARNIPPECYDRIRSYESAGHAVRVVAFPPAGGNRWVIVTDRNSKFARNIPSECNSKIDEFIRGGRQIRSVAFPPAGGNRWVVVADGDFFARNIPDECYQILRNLGESPRPGTAAPRQVHHVAFTPSGGWIILADDYAFPRNIPQECADRVNAFRRANRKVHSVTFTPSSGWSVISNEAITSRPRDEIRTFESSVMNGSVQQYIWRRMRAENVPGVAVACVLDNRLAWSCGYGHLKGTSGNAVHPESVFQAASISKTLAAVGVMRLLELNRDLTLTSDIRDVMDWKLPVNRGFRQRGVPTIERLLTHRAGVNVSGFRGYNTSSTRQVPTLDEVLAGRSSRSGVTVNSSAIRVTMQPGNFAYSGGGYLVLQKLIEEKSGRSFARFMQDRFFGPLGMNRSTFALKPPTRLYRERQVTTAHDANGNSHQFTPGRIFPESAAAGLLTTAEDLARFVIMINEEGRIGRTRVLRSQSVEDMLDSRLGRRMGPFDAQGLGFRLNRARTHQDFRYGHGGTNGGGFKALYYGYPNRRGGVVVLTNGSAANGSAFRRAVARAVASAYGWS